ncbi:metalloprotease-like protein [Planomonospora sphaerica]|uniref:Metalloprotease-like protein n=1 Tax=Planomonospora sphaerica TaxID=161355 RepID=A0A161LL16_9ACTN|nr:metalloprotease-like protein [Planomonospora sphaerica]
MLRGFSRPGALNCPVMRLPMPGTGFLPSLRRPAALVRWVLPAAVCLAVLPPGAAQAAAPGTVQAVSGTVRVAPGAAQAASGTVRAEASAGRPAAENAPVRNPFAGTGRLAATSCPEPPITEGGIPRTREYLAAAVKCLDRAWSAHFSRAGLRFRAPAVRFHEELPEYVCGVKNPHVDALYCIERATLVFPLTGMWIEDRTDLYPLRTAAHEYGHHLQSLTGIRRAYEARAGRGRGSEAAELKRRYELQADCLAGVFLGGVRHSLARTGRDWEALSDTLRARGDDPGYRTHGTGANRVRWFRRGLDTVSPAACDTWSAPPSRVS